MASGCEVPLVEYGKVTLLEGGRKAVTRCYDGYHHTSGDLIRICNAVNGTWTGHNPLCQLLPGMSSTLITLLIVVPIVLFFAVCLPIDYYFFIRRKQELREQQGMVYHRELRRVGMTRASRSGTLDEPDPAPPLGAFGSVQKHIMRFKSLINVLSLKRKVTGRGEGVEKKEKDVEEEVNSASESGPEMIAESESESDFSVNTVRGIRPVHNHVTNTMEALERNEPIVMKVCPMEPKKLAPINQVHPVENKRQLYAMKRPPHLNMASREKCVPEPIAVPLTRSVHI